MKKIKRRELVFNGSKGNLFLNDEQVLYRIYYILHEKRKALNAKIEFTLHMHECIYCRLGFVLASLI